MDAPGGQHRPVRRGAAAPRDAGRVRGLHRFRLHVLELGVAHPAGARRAASEPGEPRLLLLAIAAGSVVSLPLAGMVVARLGAARTVVVTAFVAAGGLAIAAIGYQVGVAPVVVGLFLLGRGNGTWDVAMNVRGSVRRAAARPLDHAALPRRVQHRHRRRGAARRGDGRRRRLGHGCTSWSSPYWWRRPFPRPCAGSCTVDRARRSTSAAPAHPLAAWTEPRTLLLGLFVFCMAFIEGIGNDWLGVAIIDGYDASPAVGVAGARASSSPR